MAEKVIHFLAKNKLFRKNYFIVPTPRTITYTMYHTDNQTYKQRCRKCM